MKERKHKSEKFAVSCGMIFRKQDTDFLYIGNELKFGTNKLCSLGKYTAHLSNIHNIPI